MTGLELVGKGLGGTKTLSWSWGQILHFTFDSWQQTELLLHPAQGKIGTNQLEDADETGPNTAGDGPGSCHQSGMHAEVLLAPLKGSCHANEVLLPLVVLPRRPLCTEPKAWPLRAIGPTLSVLELDNGLTPLVA